MSSIDDELIALTGSAEAADTAKQVAVEAAKAGITADQVHEAVRAMYLLRMFDFTYDEARKILHAAAVKRAGGWAALLESGREMGFDVSTWRKPGDA